MSDWVHGDWIQVCQTVGLWLTGGIGAWFVWRQNTILHKQNKIMETQNGFLDRQLDLQRDGQLESLKERLRVFLQEMAEQKLRFDDDERRREILRVFYRLGLSRASIYELTYLAALNAKFTPKEAHSFAGHTTYHGCPDDPEELKAREKYEAEVRIAMRDAKNIKSN